MPPWVWMQVPALSTAVVRGEHPRTGHCTLDVADLGVVDGQSRGVQRRTRDLGAGVRVGQHELEPLEGADRRGPIAIGPSL